MSDWLLVAGMAALTFGPRYLPFGLAGRIELPPLMSRALGFVPIAVLSAIVAQTSLIRDGVLRLDADNHHLLALVFSLVIARLSRSLSVTIILGLAFYGLLEWLL